MQVIYYSVFGRLAFWAPRLLPSRTIFSLKTLRGLYLPHACSQMGEGGGGRSDHEQGVTGAKTEWDVAQSLLFGLDRRQHPTQISHLSRGSPVPRPGPTQASNLFGSNVENLARVGIVAS